MSSEDRAGNSLKLPRVVFRCNDPSRLKEEMGFEGDTVMVVFGGTADSAHPSSVFCTPLLT